MTTTLSRDELHVLIAKASDQVIVHHADGLHEGVADRGADELEAAAEEIFAHSVGLRGVGGNLLRLRQAFRRGWPSTNCQMILIERAEFRANPKNGLSHWHRRSDFKPVANDAGIREEPGDFLRAIAGDLFGNELSNAAR